MEKPGGCRAEEREAAPMAAAEETEAVSEYDGGLASEVAVSLEGGEVESMGSVARTWGSG